MDISKQQQTVLSVDNLSVSFLHEGTTHYAVKNISFELHKGETLGIVGESGSGKSLTSLAIMGLLPVNALTQGDVIFHGNRKTNLLSLPEKEMRKWRGNKIAMIFQEPMTSLNPAYRCGVQVIENILEHEHIHYKEAKTRVLTLFEEVMLPDPERIFNAYPHQLSGGQKQRVMIAMALACNPDILIADEPTTALDVTVQKNILLLLKSLQQKHKISLVFISHNLDVIAEVASDVLVMYKGEIVEQGSISEIFNHPQHAYTKGLLACRPPMLQRPRRLQTIHDFIEKEDFIYADNNNIGKEERFLSHARLYSTPPLIKVENLSTSFVTKRNFFGKPLKKHLAVNNVNFDIYEGETLGLVGESGCGKTTLGRTLLRLSEPSLGSIIYKHILINELNATALRNLRKDIQIIFQDPYSSLNPRLTVGEAILEPMRVHALHGTEKERRAKMEELLIKVGLSETHSRRYPHEFSGGQRQRICIARSISVEPRFIICDESVSALDVSVQAQILNLLNDLKKEMGLTYLFISHDLSVVRYMSDRLMVMQQGSIVEMGEADDVYERPATTYTKTLLDAIPKGIIKN